MAPAEDSRGLKSKIKFPSIMFYITPIIIIMQRVVKALFNVVIRKQESKQPD